MTQSVVLVDDHPLVLEGLRALIQRDGRFTVVGEYSDAEAALAGIEKISPDIAVIDLVVGRNSGLEILKAIVAKGGSTRVVLLGAVVGDAEVCTAVDQGVCGIILKEWAPDRLIDCLETVAKGNRWLPEDLVKDAAERERLRRALARRILDQLSARERDVALLVAEGLTTKRIAYKLSLAEGTIKLHLHNTFRKLQVEKRADLIRMLGEVHDLLAVG
jgi:two-component system nitrate/nitrite response regulator NarL